MFGLWYAIVGLVSATLCSIVAKRKNRTQKNWYMLGQIFPVISLFVLVLLDSSVSNSFLNGEEINKKSEDGFMTQFVNNYN